MIVTTKELFEIAYGKFAIGAYNINNMEQALGLFQGNIDSQAPFIIQISKGARKYASVKMIEAIIRAAEEIFPEAIFAVHLDHGDEETCYDCIDSGFYSSVMIDASHDPFDENVAITRRVVERGPRQGHQRRGRAGHAGRRGRGHRGRRKARQAHRSRTRPPSLCAQTGCDSLAVAIGTSHGAYKFTGRQGLHFDRMAEIQQRLPGFPLVMHGSSSVPQRRGGAHQRRRRRDGPLGAGRGRGRVCQGRAAGRDQGQHRHRRPPGVDPRPPRVLPRSSRKSSTFATPGKIFVAEYAKFIAHKNEKLGSAGQLEKVRAALS